MEISQIIYYTRENGKGRPLSLRNLCTKDESKGLETIFYLIKDATDIQDLLEKWADTYYERIEFVLDTPGYISLTVVDAYGTTNYLKLRKLL